MTTVGNLLAVELQHHVAGFETRFGGRTVIHHVTNERAALILEFELLRQRGIDVLNHHSQIAARHLTVLYEAFHHGSGDVRRDGESDSLTATGTAEDGGVNSDQPPLDVHERAARVARIDRGVGLNEILVRFNSHIATVSRADDAFRHGLSYTEWVANRKHHVADLHLVAVGHGDDG